MNIRTIMLFRNLRKFPMGVLLSRCLEHRHTARLLVADWPAKFGLDSFRFVTSYQTPGSFSPKRLPSTFSPFFVSGPGFANLCINGRLSGVLCPRPIHYSMCGEYSSDQTLGQPNSTRAKQSCFVDRGASGCWKPKIIP